MAFTRFNYDESRTKKQLQQSTDPGRWVMDVPGNGDSPYFMEDPHIIIQKWGGNLRTNTVNLESSLKGVNRQVGRDCLDENYNNFNVETESIRYPKSRQLFTEQSRATNPVWWYRDLEQNHRDFPLIDPQLNTCLHFQNNLNTRILEKDHYTPKRDNTIYECKNLLPITNLLPGMDNNHTFHN